MLLTLWLTADFLRVVGGVITGARRKEIRGGKGEGQGKLGTDGDQQLKRVFSRVLGGQQMRRCR